MTGMVYIEFHLNCDLETLVPFPFLILVEQTSLTEEEGGPRTSWWVPSQQHGPIIRIGYQIV